MPTWILASFIAEQITPNWVASNCTSYSCPLCGFCEWGFGSDSWAGLAWCSCWGSVQCGTPAISGRGSSGGSLSDSWRLGVGCHKGRSVPVQGFSPWIFLRILHGDWLLQEKEIQETEAPSPDSAWKHFSDSEPHRGRAPGSHLGTSCGFPHNCEGGGFFSERNSIVVGLNARTVLRSD